MERKREGGRIRLKHQRVENGENEAPFIDLEKPSGGKLDFLGTCLLNQFACQLGSNHKVQR